MIEIIDSPGRNLAVAPQRHLLVNSERRIDGNLAIHHHVDGVLDLGALQIQGGQALQGGQTEQRARVLGGLNHPAECELIDRIEQSDVADANGPRVVMRDLMVGFHKALAQPGCRHVAQPLLLAFVPRAHENRTGRQRQHRVHEYVGPSSINIGARSLSTCNNFILK